MTRTTSLMLATGLATMAFMQPAMALDAEAFIDRIEAVYKVMGYDLSFGAATLDGDTVTVDGGTMSLAGMGEDPFTFDTELTFTGVVENDDGSYAADQLSVPDIDTEFASDPVGRLTLTDVVIEDIWLPPEGETGAEFLMQTMGRLATGPLSVTRDGVEVFSYDSFDYTAEFSFDGEDALETITTDFTIANIAADLIAASEDDAEAAATIEALDLANISGNITQVMSWTMADGRMVIDEFLFDFADIGALDIKADIIGFTPDLLDKIYAMQATEVDPTSEEGQAQQMMMGMEIAQALSIASASIRYDDASFAGKLLDYFAEQSGTDRAAYVEGLKATLPALIEQSGVPALADLVVPPVSAFLDDPQSLEVAVAPASPTSFLVLAAAAANPAGLVQALGLTVTANEATE